MRKVRQHIFQTFQINLLSQIPFLLFFFRFIWNTGNLLPLFFGFTQGLAGLSGTLAFQRQRVASLRATKTAEHLIYALSSDDFIITPARWKEHCTQKASREKINGNIENGIAFMNFTVAIPSRSTQSFPKLDCIMPAGSIHIIQAPSGSGKSTLLMALMHMLEHEGEIYFIKDKSWENIHALSPAALAGKIFFCREENIDKSFRLVDLFQTVVQKDLSLLYANMEQNFGESITHLAWEAADNLVEQEIKHIGQGKPSVFSNSMLPLLSQMRQERNNLVSSYLKKGNGNLFREHIHPERNFVSLSAGEKRRAVCLLALEQARTHSDLQMIILDEPLAHLDEKSIDDQIEIIREIQQLPSSPTQLIVAHYFIDKLTNNVPDVKLISFLNTNCR